MDSPQTLVQDRLERTAVPREIPAEESHAQPERLALDGDSRQRRLTPRLPGARQGDGASTTLLHGRYRLLERLGAGGFGVVWRAHDELLHREVALKRIPLPPDLPAPAGSHEPPLPAGERATREALASARLAHPAIVALHEAYVDGDAFHLVSELVEGATLAQLLARDALSDEELLEIGIALAQALAHAHARGVVHRDVKPQNVLVPHDPAAHETPAKLADFGGASLSGEDALTRTGETLGTLAYMAPEQSEGWEVDELADVYSLALVLYEGFTGVNPVRGPTPAATARRIGRSLPPLAARRPDLPLKLARALDTALAVDPARRGTLTELAVALERSLAEGLTSRRGPRRPRIASPPRGHPADTRELDGARDLLAPAHRFAPHRRAPAPAEAASMDQAPTPTRRMVLPRTVWLGCLLALAAWQLASARPGVALLLLAACAPVLLMGARPGVGWLTCLLAPVLGIAGLAGAYPAIAGQAGRWSQRAALGALGYWWLLLAGPLLAGGSMTGRLWLAPSPDLPARAVWEGSLGSAATHVLAPALTTGLLFGAALWAAAAVVLPWLVRGRSAILDALAAVLWSAALLAATPYLDAGGPAGASVAHPRGAVLGAVLGAALAIAARALRGPVLARHP